MFFIQVVKSPARGASAQILRWLHAGYGGSFSVTLKEIHFLLNIALLLLRLVQIL